MNLTLKRYLMSSLTTFITIFLATISIQVSGASGVLWSTTFWFTVALTAFRAAVKGVVEGLGGTSTTTSA